MKYSVKEQQGISVISLDGSMLGGPEANSLNNELHHLIDHGRKSVIVDLTKVGLMNSTGLGLLIGGYTALRNAGGRLCLAGANENIQTLIRITKLNTIFLSYPTLEKAIAGLQD